MIELCHRKNLAHVAPEDFLRVSRQKLTKDFPSTALESNVSNELKRLTGFELLLPLDAHLSAVIAFGSGEIVAIVLQTHQLLKA